MRREGGAEGRGADAARGVLVGLAAGDRNGGPVQMALTLAEAAAELQGRYDPEAVFARYRAWWDGGRGVDAWDTGPVAAQVFRRTGAGARLREIERAAFSTDQSLGGQTAGANALHRAAPLALLPLAPEDLAACARQESRLTHWSPASQCACAVLCELLRRLVAGERWDEALAEARRAALEADLVLDGDVPEPGGYSVAVLRSAVHFVGRAGSFGEALAPALAFAGPDNYCPVTVGALAGARFGAAAIPPAELVHCRPGVAERCAHAADALLAAAGPVAEPADGPPSPSATPGGPAVPAAPEAALGALATAG